MADLHNLLSFVCGSVVIGMLSAPCAAVDRSAVEYVQHEMEKEVEVYRVQYCDICTYVCPRLFDRMQTRGLQGLFETEDAEPLKFVEPYITPLIEPLQSFSENSITAEDCKNICSPLLKEPLKDMVDEHRADALEASRQFGGMPPFTPAVIDIAFRRIHEKVELDPDLIYSCRDDVAGRPEVGDIMRVAEPRKQEYFMYLVQNWFPWE